MSDLNGSDSRSTPQAARKPVRPTSLIDALYADNGKWALIYVAVASAAGTFVLAGRLGWEVGGAVIVVLVVTALAVTAVREIQARKAAEKDLERLRQSAVDPPKTAPDGPSDSTQEPVSKPGAAIESPMAASAKDQSNNVPQGEPPAAEGRDATNSGDQKQSVIDEDDPTSKAIQAAVDHDPEGVDAALGKYIDDADSEQMRAERESFRLYLAVYGGRLASVGQLRSVADEHPSQSKIAERLAYALEFIGEARQAAEELERRRSVLSDGQSRIAVIEARLRLKLGEPQIALELSRGALASATDSADRANALIQEGYALEALKLRVEAFASFEQALVLLPTNSSLRFHLAYEYYEDGFDTVALSHYETLMSQDPSNSTVNNLAVAYRKLGMPIRGVEYFQRAAIDKSAQAHGNLAHLLIDAGFVAEAVEHLEVGEAIEHTNERIASAVGRIPTLRDTEGTKNKDAAKVGSQLREVFIRLDTRTASEIPIGSFTSQNGHTLVLEPTPDGVAGKLDEEWDIEVKASVRYLDFTLSKGPALFKTRASGRGMFRGGVLAAYFRDFPSSGVTTAFIARVSTQPDLATSTQGKKLQT
jgi:tetratricopeptide (TPR) repeat protein